LTHERALVWPIKVAFSLFGSNKSVVWASDGSRSGPEGRAKDAISRWWCGRCDQDGIFGARQPYALGWRHLIVFRLHGARQLDVAHLRRMLEFWLWPLHALIFLCLHAVYGLWRLTTLARLHWRSPRRTGWTKVPSHLAVVWTPACKAQDAGALAQDALVLLESCLRAGIAQVTLFDAASKS
jgi:hypothetical protein